MAQTRKRSRIEQLRYEINRYSNRLDRLIPEIEKIENLNAIAKQSSDWRKQTVPRLENEIRVLSASRKSLFDKLAALHIDLDNALSQTAGGRDA